MYLEIISAQSILEGKWLWTPFADAIDSQYGSEDKLANLLSCPNMAWKSMLRKQSWWEIVKKPSGLQLQSVISNRRQWNDSSTLVQDPNQKSMQFLHWQHLQKAWLKTIYKDKKHTLQYKLSLFHALVLSVLLYASESWTLTAGIQRWIQVAEMRYFRCLRGISYTDHAMKEEAHRGLNHQINKVMLTSINKTKQKWYTVV